jgi:TonB-linked SusC/RagA family outer membrane protein
MYKKNVAYLRPVCSCFSLKLLLMMKLVTIVLITGIMHANAAVYGQQVSLNVKNMHLKEIFSLIRKQTGYDFVYYTSELNTSKPVTLLVKKENIKSVLDKCLADQPFTYKINSTTVSVRKKQELSSAVVAQSILIVGKVTDDIGKPIAGVSIRVKNLSVSTISDHNGSYKISVPNVNSILQFSYLGYATQEKVVGSNTVLNITLKEEVAGLNQVVVIGYGAVKRGDITGAVADVKLGDLQKAPVLSIDQALAGRVAGVSVSSNDGQPGAEMNIVIRGGNSLTQSNSPLYVIDGFPLEDASLLSINPEDIKSMTILKDASATAIYGSRGANGVVVIETKQSEGDNKTNVAYSNNIGFQQVNNRLELMEPYEFVKYQYEANSQAADILYLANKGRTIEDYRGISGIDWQDHLFRDGFYHNHSLTLSGGGKTRFYSSFSYANQQGPIIKTGYDRLQGRLNLNHDTKNAKLFLGINYTQDKSFGDVSSSPETATYSSYTLFRAWAFRPTSGTDDSMFFDDIIDPESAITTTNPIIDLNNLFRESRKNNLFINASATFKLTKDLEFKARAGASKRNFRDADFYNSLTSRGTMLLPGSVKGVNGSVYDTQMSNWLNENTLTYSKKVHHHSFTGLVGLTMQQNDYSRFGLGGEQLPNENLGLSGLDQGTVSANTAIINKNFLMSYLARADYNYKSKYLLTLTFRADGSSKFSDGNKWGYFPSAAFAWKMKNENFFHHLNFLTDAKLRTSFGYTGNNRIADFTRFSQITMPYGSNYSFNNGNPTLAAIPSVYGNTDLKWETTRQLDLGLDLAFLKNRIRFTADVYDKVTDDLLLSAPVPYTTGFTNIYKNIGSINNRGLEFSLSTDNIKNKDFSWTSDFNISFNRNKIRSLTDEANRLLTPIGWSSNFNTVNLYMAQVGGPSAMFYGLVWDGVYTYDDFDLIGGDYVLKNNVPTNGSARNAIQPGFIKYKDLNDDGIININDNTIIGRGLPVHIGGFNNNFKYKNWGLNVFFQWSYGNNVMNANRMYLEGNINNSIGMNQLSIYKDRWTPENPNSTLHRVGGQGPAGYYSNRTLEDGSFLRLKTVNLSYSLPRLWIKRMNLKNLELNVAAQNIYTWTNYSGMDPEVSLRNSALTPGFDFSVYPIAKTLVFGLKTNF